MKKYFRTRTLRIALVSGVLLAVAGSVAYATIPDGGKVFHACMLNNVGTMRLIDQSLPSGSLMSHCTSFETAVAWNQTGQQGLPGLQGPAGPQGSEGPAGPTGPSDAYAVQPAGADCCPVLTKDRTEVARLTLPAGSYVLTGKASIQNTVYDPDAPVTATCEIHYADRYSEHPGDASFTVVDNYPKTTSPLAMVQAFTLATEGSATLNCDAYVASASGLQSPVRTVVHEMSLAAIKVGAIH
jgi:hypothetical protein